MTVAENNKAEIAEGAAAVQEGVETNKSTSFDTDPNNINDKEQPVIDPNATLGGLMVEEAPATTNSVLFQDTSDTSIPTAEELDHRVVIIEQKPVGVRAVQPLDHRTNAEMELGRQKIEEHAGRQRLMVEARANNNDGKSVASATQANKDL